MTTIAYTLIFGLLAGMAVSVMYALYWAIRQGQFANFKRGATSIFDEDEPMGFRTDAFPDEAIRQNKGAGVRDKPAK